MKPITPAEARGKKKESIPPEVFEVFNQLLTEKYAEDITITQNEVMTMILKALPNVKRQQVFDRGWLDIEDVYRSAGWAVEYEKPAYNESGEAFWTFSDGRFVDGR
jgi:hypothetical protein